MASGTQWRLRRMVYDGGEWYCALSRQPELPEWLDHPIQANHPESVHSSGAGLFELVLALPQSRLFQAEEHQGRRPVPTTAWPTLSFSFNAGRGALGNSSAADPQ
jgi:hypothetical protein